MKRNGTNPGGHGFAGRNKENFGPNNKLHQPTYIQEFEGYPNNRIEFKSETETIHPTQKPVPLMEYLINTYTLPGEIVLDFTMGSGTTGVACVNTGREFIGIEKDPDYFRISEKRINAAHMTKLGLSCKACGLSGAECPPECPLTPIERPHR